MRIYMYTYIYTVIQSDRRWTWWIWGNLNINIIATCCIFVRTTQQRNSTNSTKPRNIIPLNPGIPSQLVTLKADRSRPTGPCRNLQNMGNVELEIVDKVCCATSKTVDLEILCNYAILLLSLGENGYHRWWAISSQSCRKRLSDDSMTGDLCYFKMDNNIYMLLLYIVIYYLLLLFLLLYYTI